jgi:hypothetical protein
MIQTRPVTTPVDQKRDMATPWPFRPSALGSLRKDRRRTLFCCIAKDRRRRVGGRRGGRC